MFIFIYYNFSEAESEVQRVKVAVIKTEEERHAMERRAGETELLMHRMVEEAERRQQEADRLRSEVSLETNDQMLSLLFTFYEG